MSPISGLSVNIPTSPQLQEQFKQLSKDLQTGNLNAAQSDFLTIQGELQPSAAAATPTRPTSTFSITA